MTNLLVIPTLVIAWLLFFVGQRIIKHCTTLKSQVISSLVFILLGIPGFLITLYYIHLFDDAVWFYQFRSLPFTELTAAGVGLFAGALAELFKKRKLVSTPFLFVILTLGIMAPCLKPIVAPIPKHQFTDNWQNNVCLQSTQSSCGPACAATIFKHFNISMSERNIARECFTYRGGTENWYIARAFRRRGCTVNYRIEEGFPNDLKPPAIAGVRVLGLGHFIAIIDEIDGIYVTGDPLTGKEEIPASIMSNKFDFTGFFMEISKK